MKPTWVIRSVVPLSVVIVMAVTTARLLPHRAKSRLEFSQFATSGPGFTAAPEPGA